MCLKECGEADGVLLRSATRGKPARHNKHAQQKSPHPQGICFSRQIETKKKLAINAIPTNHTNERNIAQSAR